MKLFFKYLPLSLFAFLFILVRPTFADTFLIGADTSQTPSGTATSNYFEVSRWVAQSTGAITKIYYKANASAFSFDYKVAIYSDQGGLPKTLLNQAQGIAVNGINYLDFPNTSVTQGATYWIADNTNATSNYGTGVDEGAGSNYYRIYVQGGTSFNDPFPSDASALNYSYADLGVKVYIAGYETPLPTPTPTPIPAIKIVASPSSSAVTVATPFAVDVNVNDNINPFNAVQATVNVSSNLSITGLTTAGSNNCNLHYMQAPTVSNPSFSGAIFGSSATNCKVYTLTLTPTSAGTGTITFTNASVKSYADNSEILSGVQNGSFTINPGPTPTGTAQTIDDSVQGTGQNQWNYVGNWGHCTSCNETNPTVTFYNASQSWDNTLNDYVTISFTGVQFSLYGATDPRDGIGAVSIDGGAETNVDFYSQTRTGNVLLWTSPILANSTHILKLRVTGTHDSNATNNYLILDRGDILTTGTLPNLSVNIYPTDTYSSSLTVTGTKDSSITSVFVNGSTANVTYPTSTTWQAQLSLSQLGNNNFAIYGKDANNNQTATTSITINKHTLGDINGDGVVDLIDASLFAVDFGRTNPSTFVYPLSDLNGDGQVDLTDLSLLAKLEQ